jgi:23S rRNA U2552 (ribose-2'-O)-methylase RlmE/FtsJ
VRNTPKYKLNQKYKLKIINNLSTFHLNKMMKCKYQITYKEQKSDTKLNPHINLNASIPQLEYGYNPILNEYRNLIDHVDQDKWKKTRWYINEYDFAVRDPIINRAFYKYWEMIQEFNLFVEYNPLTDIILHAAEAPGGFIQGSLVMINSLQSTNTQSHQQSYQQSQQQSHQQSHQQESNETDQDGFTLVKKKEKPNRQNNKNDIRIKIYTMSLNKELALYRHFNLPAYNKIVLHNNVRVLYGKDNTGDLNNVENIKSIETETQGQLFYLITGDGGFDEGSDFNHKEQLHYKLILNEILVCMTLQSQNGHFILKMFDIFTETSINLLYLLSICFKEIYIYKPLTSRPTNSEKFIICKYFNISDCDKKNIINGVLELKNQLELNESVNTFDSFTLLKSIPQEFITEIKNINTNLIARQCQFLKKAIDICQSETNSNELEMRSNHTTTFLKWKKDYNYH